jgi:thioredoxin-dependent peroxiredoxin
MNTGDMAPDFTAPTNGGGALTLSALRGKPVVLYFYPKDDTPGCTTEAKDFTALADQFEAVGAVVVGVSKDSVAKHDKFAAKHDLGVILVSDEESDICERYGVWGEKSMYGKTFMGITRATFLIDAEGRIAQSWPKVKVAGHAEEVLAAVKAL